MTEKVDSVVLPVLQFKLVWNDLFLFFLLLYYIWALREATTNSIYMMARSANQSVKSRLSKGCAQEMVPSLWQRTVSYVLILGPLSLWLCESETGYWGNTVVGSGLVRKRIFSAAVAARRCVCGKHRASSCAERPQNPDGARPMIRQTSKRPLVEDLSPISILHISWTWRWLRVTGFHHSSGRTQWTGHRVMLSVPLV